MSSTESKELLSNPQPDVQESNNATRSVPPLRKFVSAAGHKYYARPNTSDSAIFEMVVDQNEYNLPSRFNADDIVIDIGAHIGGFSYASLDRGAGKVYAYEAHPENHAIASQNLQRFAERISCEQKAVWRSDQPSQTLYNADLTGSTNTGGVSLLWNNEGDEVATISLDEILARASDDFRKPIRLLKLDCEGSEYPILFTSEQLGIVQEVCGEYHEVPPERIPERAKVPGSFERFDRFALKDFFEERGWSIVLEPKAVDLGLFHARSNSHSQTRAPEFNVEEFMSQVREAVRLREAKGETSFINASAELFKLLTAEGFFVQPVSEPDSDSAWTTPRELPALRLQPAFIPRADDYYHVNDLLKFHDREFVWNAYRAILKREPDEVGLRDFLKRLRNGSRNKIDILASLRASAEGKRVNVSVEGLAVPALIRKVYRLPLIGYVAEMTVAIARLPKLVRSRRQFESHVVAQQDRIALHISQTNHQLLRRIETLEETSQTETDSLRGSLVALRESLLKLYEVQKQLATVQHQQVSALFREQQNARANTETVAGKQPTWTADFDEIEASLAEYLRGDADAVKQNLSVYLSLLKESGITKEILDLGCGSGAWLEVLKESGLEGRGVEANPKLVEIGRKQGFEVTQGDVIEHLKGLPEGSLQAVTAFHLVEHVEFHQLLNLLIEIRRVLKPGGLVILETPNPKNLVVGACNFYADPTHRQPTFPETLQFLLERLGFVRTRIEYLHPATDSPFQNSEPGSKELHTWLFGPRDYAAIGRKP